MPKMYSLYSEASMLPRRMSHASNSLRSSRGSVRRSAFFARSTVEGGELLVVVALVCILVLSHVTSRRRRVIASASRPVFFAPPSFVSLSAPTDDPTTIGHCQQSAAKHRRVATTNSPMQILFLHGWQSIPGGVKPTYLKDHGYEVINPKLPDDDFDEAVRIAQHEFDEYQPDVVVGSSRGGAVAMNINSGDAKLVLLCPAWKKWGTAKTVKPSTEVLHSRADDVVPFADSEELARVSGATLIEVGNDHRLADPEPLEAMLKACSF